MTIHYIDSNFTGVSDGSLESPYKHFLDVPSWSAGDIISMAEESEYFLTDINGIELRTNAQSGNEIVWKCTTPNGDFNKKPVIYQATRYSNNATYQWNDSGVNGEYYLTLAGGGNPLLVEPKSGTVDGYYRGSSCQDTNSALEQRATDTVSGNDPVIETMADKVWGWGSGATTALSFNTIWFKPEVGKTPDDYDIILSSGNYVLRDNNTFHNFEDVVLSHGNVAVVNSRQASLRVYNRCVIANADFTGVISGTNSTSVKNEFNNCIFSQGHRAVATNHDVGETVLNNCIIHNLHIVALDSKSNTFTLSNCIVVGGESGLVDIGSGTTFNQNNNIYYQRHNGGNDASKKLRYITDVADYPSSGATSIPANLDSDQLLTSADLVDPQFVAFTVHNWGECDFRLQSTSPCIGSGTPIAGLSTDAIGATYDLVAPNMGIFAGVGVASDTNYTVCSLTVSNSYQSTQFQASTVCPLGRDWGTKRYTADGVIIPNYIHEQ